MHIVEIAPPWFPIPPSGYGGIERVIYDLVEGFVEAGHEVTLFAPAGSHTRANLVPTLEESKGLDLSAEEKWRIGLDSSRRAFQTADELDADIVNDHTDFHARGGYSHPIFHTIHGPAVDPYIGRYRRMSQSGHRFLAVSHRQRELFEIAAAERFGPGHHIAFAGVVHNPIDVHAFRFYPATEKSDYVAYLGRCHWEKDPAAAIRVAKAAGIRLKMAMRVSDDERPYFDAVVKPLLDRNQDLVEFIGEIGAKEKAEVLGRARATLFTSPWEEPFGLVMTESLAHGTPVIALARGAAPEVIEDGVSGVLCEDEEAMAPAIVKAMTLVPEDCRQRVEVCFDRRIIAERYLEIFERVAASDRGTRADSLQGYQTASASAEAIA